MKMCYPMDTILMKEGCIFIRRSQESPQSSRHPQEEENNDLRILLEAGKSILIKNGLKLE